MQNAQTITVQLEVTDGIDPQEAVDAINGALSGGWDEGTDEPGYFVTTTAGTEAYAVEGEPFRAGKPGQAVRVGKLSLVFPQGSKA